MRIALEPKTKNLAMNRGVNHNRGGGSYYATHSETPLRQIFSGQAIIWANLIAADKNNVVQTLTF